MITKQPLAYVVTLRIADVDDETGSVTPHPTGIDVLLNVTETGYLLFPHELFIEARNHLLDAEKTGGVEQ